MSEVKRFEMEKEYSLDINIVPTEYPDGSFVHYDDYAALQEQLAQRNAQIAALTAENLDLKHPGTYLPLKRETPATDAAANALRAEGAIAARNALVVAGDGSDIYATVTAVIEQLREGK